MEEKHISGNVYWSNFGDDFIIRNPYTNQGWGVPVRNITSEDLRKMADYLEEWLKENGAKK